MPKYAIFDEKGLPKAFYDSGVHASIPQDAVQITDEQWLELLNNQGKRAFVNNEIINIANKVWDDVNKVWRDKTEDEIFKESLIRLKKSISSFTNFYIQQKLSSIDEDLADITSEAQVIEGRILYIAAKEGITITTDEVKQKITLFIAGSYTQGDVINDLKEKGLSDETVQSILPLLARAVEIAKMLNWKEEIWQKEAELEEQVDSMSLKELLQVDVKKLCEDAYSEIPLKV